MIAPKPASRSGRVSLWRYWRLFRRDLLSAQPEHLYRAKMAEFRTPFFRSFMVNEPPLISRVLVGEPNAFHKSVRVTRGLAPLLGQSVFVTNGAQWAQQRRMIDPAFEGGRVRAMFPAMLAAARAAVERVKPGEMDFEDAASHAMADVIFRAMFSTQIDEVLAQKTYRAFRAFQRKQPVASAAAFLPWLPVLRGRREAARLRALVAELVARRRASGEAPDDLATRLITAVDPESGGRFNEADVVDQCAIFFLAGHETSASLLGWATWLLAASPEWAERVAAEAADFMTGPSFSRLSVMPVTRNVVRETLRLYPPVPMFVREATAPAEFRGRHVRVGDQIVVSPWHLQRNERYWEGPDRFDPGRWESEVEKGAYLPFSKGPRVCPGAGFAMTESVVMLAALFHAFRFETVDTPVPVAHLTVRSRDGIRLLVVPRET